MKGKKQKSISQTKHNCGQQKIACSFQFALAVMTENFACKSQEKLLSQKTSKLAKCKERGNILSGAKTFTVRNVVAFSPKGTP